MSFIETIAPAAASGDVHGMYERQQGRWGYVPNYARTFSARPDLMPLWADLLAGIRRHIEPRRFELATVAAAAALGSSSCSLAHGKLLCHFLPQETVAGIARAAASGTGVPALPGLSALDQAIVGFAARAARSPGTTRQEDIEALRAGGMSDAEIFDVAAAVAGRCFFAGLIESLGTQPDTALGALEPALRDALTVGRPVSEIASEALPAV